MSQGHRAGICIQSVLTPKARFFAAMLLSFGCGGDTLLLLAHWPNITIPRMLGAEAVLQTTLNTASAHFD